MTKQLSLKKTPLRYPGGKSRGIKTISQYLPQKFSEYREPFIGGGSVFIYLKQIYPDLKFWINDLNPELYLFWKIAQSNLSDLIQEITHIKNNRQEGKKIFEELTTVNLDNLSELERAVRFFVLNRITFSGTVESGGFSEQAFQKRFTESSIKRLEQLEIILKDVKMTNLDYREVLLEPGENIFTFLDPPYLAATPSRLYGKDGNLHTSFDHKRFANTMKHCQHQWLITYDNSPEIKTDFADFNIIEWELQYGMNNYKQGKADKGKELIITNYPVTIKQDHPKIEQLSLDLFF